MLAPARVGVNTRDNRSAPDYDVVVPIVRVSAALKSRADNRAEHAVGGRSIGEALHELERSCPALSGWILDERGLIRPHISVFVNGSRGALDTAVGPADRVEILRALSGG